MPYLGTPKVIPTPDFRIFPGGRKRRKTLEKPGVRNPGVGITFGLLDIITAVTITIINSVTSTIINSISITIINSITITIINSITITITTIIIISIIISSIVLPPAALRPLRLTRGRDNVII